MKNVLVIVNTKFAHHLLTHFQLNIYPEPGFIKKICNKPLDDFWLVNTDQGPELSTGGKQLLQPLVDYCLQYKTIVLALTPGACANRLPGLLSLALAGVPVKIKTTGTQPLEYLLFKNLKGLQAVNTGDLFGEFTRLKIAGVLNTYCQHKPPSGVAAISNLKEALLLKYLSIRETENECQKASHFYQVIINVKHGKRIFPFTVVRIGKEDVNIHNIHYAKALISRINDGAFTLQTIQKKQINNAPLAPFTTQTLLAEVERLWGYSAAKTMNALKKLYKGVDLGNKGTLPLISYYRTTSTHVNKEVVQALREYIYTNYGADYLPARATGHGKGQPKGHAVHPLDLRWEPRKVKKYLSQRKYRIYSLIWQRSMASQMSKAKSEHITVSINDDKDDTCIAQAEFTNTLFRGYRQVYDERGALATEIRLPENWRPGSKVKIDGYEIKTVATERPERYNVSELLQKWQQDGAGTISDFFHQTGILFAKHLIEYKKKSVFPTNAGYDSINSFLLQYHNLVTPGVVIRLDKLIETVASDNVSVHTAIAEAEKLLRQAIDKSKKIICPECGGRLIPGPDHKMVCEHYPTTCVYQLEADHNNKKQEPCPECGAKLVLREGKFGRFWACSRYPRCHYTTAFTLDIECPAEGCDGRIVEKKSAKGQLFYGCSRYPDCKFSASQKPVNMICSHCGHSYLLENELADGHMTFLCPECSHVFNEQFSAIN